MHYYQSCVIIGIILQYFVICCNTSQVCMVAIDVGRGDRGNVSPLFNLFNYATLFPISRKEKWKIGLLHFQILHITIILNYI